MKTVYGVMPETFKLVWGNKSEMNLTQLAEMPKSISLVSGKKDTAAFQIVISADQSYALNLSKAPWFSQNSKRRNLRLSAEMPFECKMNHVGLLVCDDGLKRGDILLDESVVEDLLTVDKATWLEEVKGIKEFYAQFGDRLPKELADELAKLEERLK